MFAKLFSIKNNANETDKATKPTRVRAEQRRSSMFSIDEYQTTIDMNRNNAIEIHLNDDDFTMHLNEETTSQSDSSSLSRPRKPGMARTRSFSTNAMNHDEFRPGSFVDAADNPKRSKVQSMNMDDMIGKSAKDIKLPSISVEVEQMNFSDPKSPVTNEAEYRNLSTGNPFNSKVAAMAPWRIHSFRASTNIGIDDENRDRFDNTEENWGDPYRDEKTQSISEVESQIGICIN